LDEIERAYRFFILARMSFSGNILATGWRHSILQIRRNMSGVVSGYLSTIENLPEIHHRIMTVQVDCLDWRTCVEKYNDWGDKGFFYMDPPYLPETRRWGEYPHEMNREDHKELIEWMLSKAKVKVMLSGYDNDLYQKLEKAGWRKICWDVPCSAVGRTRLTKIIGENATLKKSQRRIECIWINYDLASE
jgi:DNA adenine methylase